MKIFLFVCRRSPALTLGAIVIGVLGGASGAALMALITARLDDPTADAGWTSVWSFAAVGLVILLCGYVSRSLMSYLSERTTYHLRLDLCRQIAATPLRQVEELGSSRALAALTQDINHLTGALVNFPALVINLAILAGCFAYLGWLSPSLLLVILAFVAFSVLTVKLPERFAVRELKLARQQWDRLLAGFQALVEGIKQLQQHAPREREFFSRWLEPAAGAYRRHSFRSFHVYAATNSWSQVLYFLFIGLLLFGLAGKIGMTSQVVVGFTITALYMRGPLVQLLDMLPAFARATVALERVERFGLSLAATGDAPRPAADDLPPRSCRKVELLGVTHSYSRESDEREFTLGPVDLSLAAGELVFLVGGNGSGKTTLAKLLTGLYRPDQGEIRLDGKAIDEANRAWYRQHFAAVFSDFHLFRQLLGLGDVAPDLDQAAARLLARLQLSHKVRVEEGELSTTELSQGQRKRLALLVALLEDRPIYVFDEWAADQDPYFKQIFYRELLPELKARGKAVLVISHDDRYYGVADRVLKIESGQLVAGTAAAEAGALAPAMAQG